MLSSSPTSKAAKYASHCNEHYAPSPQGPKQAESMTPNPGPPPTNQIAIITCMDARLDVFQMFGLSLGESHIIRVGGGRAPDALRSLMASEHVLETKEVMVVHHTDCGFSKPDSEEMARGEIQEALGGTPVDWLAVMPLKKNLHESVKDDMRFLKDSPYVKKDAIITGWIYDTTEGTIRQVQ